ncbi:unnamed protein product [Staurois parvus]|uniref:Uncharacterized protein n=1 Tax=Staurois parvus TaxID=386267 RepID=A0ABN9ARN5_9NEOB|nr:unnamed protein product [Staurois parvus]
MKLSKISCYADTVRVPFAGAKRLCIQLATFVHCALQHALTPLCHFTWPTTYLLAELLLFPVASTLL